MLKGFTRVLFCIIICGNTNLFAATNTANGVGTGTWAGASWSAGHIPLSTEDVFINSGINLTIGTAAVCGSLTIGNDTNSLTTLTLGSGGSLTISGTTGNLTLNPNNRASTYTLDVGAQTVSIAGSVTFLRSTDQILVSATGGSLSFTNAGGITWATGLLSMTANGSVSFTGLLSQSSGTIENITTAGTMNFNGGLTVSGGTFATLAGENVNIGNNLTVSTNPLTFSSNIFFTGNSTVTPTAAITFHSSVTINSLVVVTLAGNVTIDNFLTVNGIYDLQTYTSNRSTSGGLFVLGASATLKLGGSSGGQTGSNFPTNFATITIPNSSIVEYNSANGVNQTIFTALPGATVYGNLILSNSTGSGLSTKTAGGNVTCANMTINSFTTFDGVSYSHQIRGDWTNSGTFTPNTSTVTFDRNGGSAASTITNASGENFNNLIINCIGGSKTVTLGNNISIAGDLSVNINGINSSTLDLSTYTANRSTSGGTLTVVSSAILKLAASSGGQAGSNFPTNFTTLSLNSASTVEYNSANGVNQTIFPVASGYGNLTLTNQSGSGSTTKTATTGLTINGALTISDAFTTFNSSSSTHTVGGNWVNNGTYNHQSGQITFNGTTTVSGSSTTTFNNILINNTSTLTAPSVANMNVDGNFVNNGTFTHNSGTVTFTNISSLGGSSAISFYNLSITGTLNGVPSGNFNVAKDFSNDGTFINQSGKVTFNGGVAQAIKGNSTTTFYDMNMSTAGTAVSLSQNANLINIMSFANSASFNTNSKTFILISNKDLNGNTFTGGGTAQIGDLTNGSFSGGVTYQRYIDGYTDWRSLGWPITGRTIADWAGTIATSGFMGSNDQFNPFVSIYTYNAATQSYVVASNTTNPISADNGTVNGRGFMVYVGNTNPGVVMSPAITLSTPNQSIVSGTLSPTITSNATGFYNFMANPYPSPILFSSFFATNANITNFYYVYDSQQGAFDTWTGSSSSSSGHRTSGTIANGQAFFVKATSGTNLTFNESHKAGTADGNYLKMKASIYKKMWLKISSSTATPLYGSMLLEFSPVSADNYDVQEDAAAMDPVSPLAPTVSSYSTDGKKLVINAMGDLVKDFDIPVQTTVGVSGSYFIEAPDLTELPGVCVALEDKVTGTITDLRANSGYTFTTDTSKTTRFILHISPVINASFSVQKDTVNVNAPVLFTNTSGGAATYTWDFGDGQTSNLQNPSHAFTSPGDYSVNLSINGDCGQKANTSNVIHVDKPTGVNNSSAGNDISIINNNNNTFVKIDYSYSLNGVIEVFDALEKCVYTQPFSGSHLYERVNIPAVGDGIYLVRVTSTDATIVKRFVIKN